MSRNTSMELPLPIDLISALSQKGLNHIVEHIFTLLDIESLENAELVCQSWSRIISKGIIWQKLLQQKVTANTSWRKAVESGNWIIPLLNSQPVTSFHRQLCIQVKRDLEETEKNWQTSRYLLRRLDCNLTDWRGVLCLQFDTVKIITGMSDKSIIVWDMDTLRCIKTLNGHTDGVLCLQFDNKKIISGSSDCTIRIWNFNSDTMVNTLMQHSSEVTNLRFNGSILVTCSKDETICVWHISTPTVINLQFQLFAEQGSIDNIGFDEKYVLSICGDRTIKVWSLASKELLRKLRGHWSCIISMDYNDGIAVSGSTDQTVRVWDVERGLCLRVMREHNDTVCSVRLDKRRIVSGGRDGIIKVWNLKSVLDPSILELSSIATLSCHMSVIHDLQFDDFQIVGCSSDDVIRIWDFFNYSH